MIQEFINRRQKLLQQMQTNSAALIFAAPAIKNNHSYYIYNQNSNFWYFTGFNEPNALLILLKKNKNNYKSILFNKKKDNYTKIWQGDYLGQQKALKSLGVNLAISWHEINAKLYLILNNLNIVYFSQGEYHFADKLLFDALNTLRLKISKNKKLKEPSVLIDLRPLIYKMRLFKSKKEISAIRYACKITSLAHNIAIKKCKSKMYEYELEAEIEYIFNRHGIRVPAYNTIVASGKNSKILHYYKNNSLMKDGELVLVDAGCKYIGYASDVTRTFPINGKFSIEQRELYNIVLNMLNYLLKFIIPGCDMRKIYKHVMCIMIQGLIKIGIIQGQIEDLFIKKIYKKFFMHKIGHWLGLDVHDLDNNLSIFNQTLEPGMVLAIEPAIYIPKNQKIPASYHNINIRIEDNIVITNTGNENLTVKTMKKINDIESIMINN